MIPVPERDEWLMAQVVEGKREYLEPLVRRYASPLLTFIHRMVGDYHRSEELFQEVFLRVWAKRHTYHPDRPFKPWLYQIAANQCRSSLRGKNLHLVRTGVGAGLNEEGEEEDFMAAQAGGEASPAEAAVDTETAAAVAQAVAELPEKQRAVVVMRLWNGLSYAEIAAAVGGREGAVRSTMHHALAALRRCLGPRLRMGEGEN